MMPLNHVALTVSDRERSAAFYGEHLGLTEVIHRDELLLILGSDDGSELALSRGTPVAAQLPRTNHFGFRVADEALVCAARDQFRAMRASGLGDGAANRERVAHAGV